METGFKVAFRAQACGETGKLYLTEECLDCGLKYGHAVEKDVEQEIKIAWHLKVLKNDKGELMRGIDCPLCNSSKTKLIALNARP